MTLDDLDLFDPGDPRPGAAPSRKCRAHAWQTYRNDGREWTACYRCGHVKDHAVSRRSRNNRSRGTRDELAVARILGGAKIGELGLPWDVETPAIRVQCKKLDRWPSLAKVLEWLDAIPVGHHARAVTLADTPGTGGKVRRLIVLDLDEFASWYGGREP